MRYLIGFLAFLGLASAAHAACEGTDLIDAMPAPDRSALEDAANSVPYPTGVLWQATKGTTKMALFGTYHIRHAQTDAHADALIPLMETADIAWFEANAEDQRRAQNAIASDPSLMFITQGPTLPDLLGDTLWPQFAAEMKARNIPGFMAAKFKPMMGAMMLGMSPCQAREGAMQAAGIDKVLAEKAASLSMQNRSLEDFRTVFSVLDGYSMDEQIEMLELSFAFVDRADDLQHTLLQRYLAQEIALIWEYSRVLTLQHGGDTATEDWEAFDEALLTSRNRAWVDLLMQDGMNKRNFIAVGAAHLPGQNGVLQLLADRGFTIQAMPFDP